MPQKVLIVHKKGRRNFVLQEIAFRAAREILNFPTFISILSKIQEFFWPASYSACVVYTKTIIHLSVGESGGYLPRRFEAR